MKIIDSGNVDILYIEDTLINFNGVKDLLSRFKEYTLKPANDLKVAKEELATNKFSVVMLDLGLPPDIYNIAPSIEFMQKTKLDYPDIVIIIFSTITYIEPDYVKAALKSSVSYVAKEDIKKGDDLHNIISVAREGNTVFTQAPSSYFKEILQDKKSEIFTAREEEVANLIHEGLSNKQIASRLGVSEFHARDLASRVYKKSETGNRAGFAVWYERHLKKEN